MNPTHQTTLQGFPPFDETLAKHISAWSVDSAAGKPLIVKLSLTTSDPAIWAQIAEALATTGCLLEEIRYR